MNILPQIATVLLGFLAGALLLLALGLVPYWQALDPASFVPIFRDNSAHIASFMMPLGFSATGLTWLALGLAMWKKTPSRNWLIAASVCALCMLATFPIYFSGANAALAEGAVPVAEISHALSQWQTVHWVRTIAAIAGCVCALKAVQASTP